MENSSNDHGSVITVSNNIVNQYNKQIRLKLLNLTYKQLPHFSVSTTFSSLVLVYIFWDKISTNTLMVWAGCLNIVLLISAVVIRRAQKIGLNDKNVRYYSAFIYAMGFTRGCIWGSIAILMYTPEIIQYQLIILIFLAIGAALVSFVSASDRLLFFLIIIPIMTPITGQFFFRQDQFHLALAFGNIIYIVTLYYFYSKSHKALLESLILQFEKSDLVAQLGLEKQASEQANKEKSRFLAIASHDLRQPIHAQTLLIQELSERIDDPKLSELIRDLKVSTTALHELFDGLLDISRLDSDMVETNIEVFSLRELLNIISMEYKNIAKGKNITLRIVAPDINVSSDRQLLNRILHNLVSNAIKHTQKGYVLIAARRRGKGKFIRVEVRDSGSGIAENQLANIFQEYYQVNDVEHEQTQGLGLGLSIVQRLADLLNHSLEVTSKSGKGSIFSITVPMSKSIPLYDTSRLRLFCNLQNFNGINILVIDDDLMIRRSMYSLLTHWGCSVTSAVSAKEACELLTDETPIPDIILADYHLRGKQTGIAAIKKIQTKLEKSIPAIIITGDTSSKKIQEISAHGFKVLHKPVPAGKLRSLIRYLTDKENTHTLNDLLQFEMSRQ